MTASTPEQHARYRRNLCVACGEDVGNDHSWALHLLAELRAAESRTVNYDNGALIHDGTWNGEDE